MSQREQLQAEIEELKAQRITLEEKVRQSFAGTSEHAQASNELANVIDKIKAKEAELAQEEASETAIAAIDSEIGSMEVEGLPLSSLFLTPGHFEFFVEWWKETEGKKAADQAALESSYKSEIASQQETIEALETGFKEAAQEVAELNESLRLSKEEVADLESKRNAAANELKDAKEEVERLTADNESLRKQLESKQYSGPTNTNANLAEMAEKLKKSLPGIYNKRWKDKNNKKAYLANLSATGEEIEIPWLEIGKYREESAEDAARFREDQAQKELEQLAQEASAYPAEPVAPELPFPGEETATNGLDQNEAVRESDAPVTRAEFEELSNRVALLEQQKGSLAA